MKAFGIRRLLSISYRPFGHPKRCIQIGQPFCCLNQYSRDTLATLPALGFWILTSRPVLRCSQAMQFNKILSISALLLSVSLPCAALNHTRRGPTSPKLFNKRSKSATKPAGQRTIDDSRASQIQASLIKSGYLSDQAASGHWDAQTQAAMQKFQEDNGWQTKLIPDSRAIIKLGLGPAQDNGSASAPSPGPANVPK